MNPGNQFLFRDNKYGSMMQVKCLFIIHGNSSEPSHMTVTHDSYGLYKLAAL